MSFSARLLKEGEEPKVVELLSTIFNGWPHFDLDCTPLDHWRWKYSHLRNGIVVVAGKEDRIIGCHHTGFLRIKVGDETSLGAQAMDLGTHPDYRGMGVNKSIDKLGKELTKNGIKPDVFTYWVSTSPIVIQVNRKAGNPVFPKPISFLMRVKDIDKQLAQMSAGNRLIKKTGYEGLKLLGKLSKSAKRTPEKEIDISVVNGFDENFDSLWYSVKEGYDFITERSSGYLNWRYADPRGGNFRVTAAREGDLLTGYLVTRINKYKPDYPEGYIVDVLALPGRLDVVEQLVSDSLRYLDENSVNITYCWLVRGHPYEKILRSYEFVDSQKEINISYGAPDGLDGLEKFRNAPPERLHFMYSSSDWI